MSQPLQITTSDTCCLKAAMKSMYHFVFRKVTKNLPHISQCSATAFYFEEAVQTQIFLSCNKSVGQTEEKRWPNEYYFLLNPELLLDFPRTQKRYFGFTSFGWCTDPKQKRSFKKDAGKFPASGDTSSFMKPIFFALRLQGNSVVPGKYAFEFKRYR